MSLPRLAIGRHVLAAALSLAILLLGVLSYGRIGVDRMPDVEFPTLTITTALPGATPATVAQSVTQPLETRLNTIAGVDSLSSVSTAGRSAITLTFDASKDMAEALNDVQTRVNQARRDLPEDAQASIVQQLDINAEPVMWLALSRKTLDSQNPPAPGAVASSQAQGLSAEDTLALSRTASALQKRIQTVKGVGEVRLRGDRSEVKVITLHDQALNALGLSYADVRQALAAQHLSAAGGRLKTEGREFQLELDFEFKDPQALRMMPVAQRGTRQVVLGDVADVAILPADNRGFARYNGRPTVALGIVKAAGANPVDVIASVRERLDEDLKGSLPQDMQLEVVSDEARPIQALVSALQSHLLEGTLLTALVTWLFLKSWRATGIIATAIPVSLLGAVSVLYFAGYTFNSFTLLALLLLIGVVVDDAIVVLENIYRVRERHPELSAPESAARGAEQVLFAVMASTLTLVCVFAPVIFLPGVLGQFFQSFAVTVVAGVLVSWFVALTLTPMLCAKFLRTHQADKGVSYWLEQAFLGLERRYAAWLRAVLRHKSWVLLAAALTLLPAAFLFTKVGKEFSPQVDEGRVVATLNLPGGLGQEQLLTLAKTAEAAVTRTPEVVQVLTTFGDGGRSGSDSLSLGLTLSNERTRAQAEVMAELEQRLSEYPQWRASVRAGSALGGGPGGAPLQFVLQGPNFEELSEQAEQLQARLSKEEGMSGLRNNLNSGLAQLSVTLRREEAARVGVTPREVAASMAVLTGQAIVGRYTAADGQRYDLVLRSSSGLTPWSPQALESVKVRGSSGELVSLSGLVSPQPEGVSSALQRVNQQYAVSFSAAPRIPLGEAMALVRQAQADLPSGYQIQFLGQAEEFRKVGGNLGLTFILALVLLYLVLASQFNAYGQPLLVMLAQPLAVIGGVGALYVTGQTLNIYSMIGLMLLVGLVAKNSILLVDRANQLVAEGLAPAQALLHACPERLRPVLMTSLTVVLAMLPAALGLGAGAENNQPLAVAVIGGMLSSTALTLLAVPAAYALFVRAPGRKEPQPAPPWA